MVDNEHSTAEDFLSKAIAVSVTKKADVKRNVAINYTQPQTDHSKSMPLVVLPSGSKPKRPLVYEVEINSRPATVTSHLELSDKDNPDDKVGYTGYVIKDLGDIAAGTSTANKYFSDISERSDDSLKDCLAGSVEDASTIISTTKLCKTFRIGGAKQEVLRDLDLDIRSGDFTVIMGQSGSGKSTLLYAISGMDAPSSGDIEFCTTKISGKSSDELALFRRKNCGFVFQQIYLCDFMTLMDNAMTSGLLVNKNRRKVAKKARQLFHLVGLTADDWVKYPAQVSGGEAQRAAIVRAMINSPKIIFADEPTGALNSSSSIDVLDLLTQANNNSQSIVMVTHDMSTALRGNRVLYLKDGVINGECNLGKYQSTGKTAARRREILRNFLQEKGW